MEHNKDSMSRPCLSWQLSNNSIFSSIPASGEEVHSAQEAELWRGVRVWQWLLRQRVQLRLLRLRGLQFRVSQPQPQPHCQNNRSAGYWNILFPVAALTATTRTRSIWEPWRWDLTVWFIFFEIFQNLNWSLSLCRTRPVPRPWEPSLKSGRLRLERTEATSTLWTRTVSHWRQPPN